MAIGVNPTRHEIELQLDRMLAHPLFEARAKQAKIFKYLVKRSLDGKEVNEQTIFGEFFTDKRYAEDTTSVRTNVSIIRRELLVTYYDQDGKDDPVIIALPAPERIPQPDGKYKVVKRRSGEAYTPVYSYNPRSPIAKALAVANHLLRGSVTQIDQAVKQLSDIWDREPNHPDVILGFAEAMGTQLTLGLFIEEAREPLIAGALGLIERLDPATADAWRIHNVRGLLFMANGELEKAQKEFDGALALDRQATIDWGWYTLFLLQVGKEEEAVRLQGLVADEKASNAGFQALHGILLTNVKRYEEAERAFTQALTLDRNSWPAHYGMAQMYLATGKQRKAEEHLKRLKTLVEPEEYEDLKRRLGIKAPGPERSV